MEPTGERAARKHAIGPRPLCRVERLQGNVRPERKGDDLPFRGRGGRALDPIDEIQRDFGGIEVHHEGADRAVGQTGLKHIEGSDRPRGDPRGVGGPFDLGGPQEIGGEVEYHASPEQPEIRHGRVRAATRRGRREMPDDSPDARSVRRAKAMRRADADQGVCVAAVGHQQRDQAKS